MVLTTAQQLIDGLPGQAVEVVKGQQNPSALGWASYWQATGYPGAGAAPSSGLAGDVPTRATAGALPMRNPSGANLLYVGGGWASLGGSVSSAGTVLVFDRLWQNSGIDATSTGAQTVNSTALTRPDANGDRAELWWQVYSTMGAATPTITITYTNSSNTGSRSASSGVMPSAAGQVRTGPFYLHSGDTGVKSVQTYQQDASYVSGTIGLVIRRRICALPVRSINDPVRLDAVGLGLARVDSGACLELVLWGASAVNNLPAVTLNLVEA